MPPPRAAVLVHCAADLQSGIVVRTRPRSRRCSPWSCGARPKTLVSRAGFGRTARPGKAWPTRPPSSPPPIVAWRPAHEQMVLSRPRCGASSCAPAASMARAAPHRLVVRGAYKKKDLQVLGDGTNWAMVHLETWRMPTSGRHRAACRARPLRPDRSRDTVAEMASAAARAAGYTGPVRFTPVAEAAKTMGPFAEALALDQHLSSWKIARRLGWQPEHGGSWTALRSTSSPGRPVRPDVSSGLVSVVRRLTRIGLNRRSRPPSDMPRSAPSGAPARSPRRMASRHPHRSSKGDPQRQTQPDRLPALAHHPRSISPGGDQKFRDPDYAGVAIFLPIRDEARMLRSGYLDHAAAQGAFSRERPDGSRGPGAAVSCAGSWAGGPGQSGLPLVAAGRLEGLEDEGALVVLEQRTSGPCGRAIGRGDGGLVHEHGRSAIDNAGPRWDRRPRPRGGKSWRRGR